ncbi:VanZ family protein [Halobacillus karajensis]|nr:VanZ family protein [Halobacillus karajensis]
MLTIAPILFKSIDRYKHIIYVAVAIRMAIEILQYNTSLGVFDIDDIILSLTGSLIGFSLYKKFIK